MKFAQKSRARIGFVATNSITQGEQVSQLWPTLFHRCKLEISFAHRTFAWGSDARGQSHVHCVIVGLTRQEDEPQRKRLFSYQTYSSDPDETLHKTLSPYLFDASGLSDRHLVVSRTRRPRADMPVIRVGSKPVDGGYFIMNGAERQAFLRAEPDAASLIRPYVGSDEHINGGDRWIVILHGESPQRIKALPRVMRLINQVRRYRLGELPPRGDADGENKKPSALSLALASTPTSFHVTVLPVAPFLAIPEVSSERREYLPIGWLHPPTVPSNKLLIALDAEPYHFALIVSKMHMAWTEFVGGRLETRYQYSPGINYNPFPWPKLSKTDKSRLNILAQVVLDARAVHEGATLGVLYDPDVMPANLRKAHHHLDLAVDKLYRTAPFASDRERVEHLFGLYEKLVTPLSAIAATKLKPRRKAREETK